eukprot:805341-Rhodomonas_salina.5
MYVQYKGGVPTRGCSVSMGVPRGEVRYLPTRAVLKRSVLNRKCLVLKWALRLYQYNVQIEDGVYSLLLLNEAIRTQVSLNSAICLRQRYKMPGTDLWRTVTCFPGVLARGRWDLLPVLPGTNSGRSTA